MSAIHGLFRPDGGPPDEATFARMGAALAAYGPDGQGAWRGPGVLLGHCMAYNTPESRAEPMPLAHPGCPDLVVTADLRLDNRDDLVQALGAARTALDVPGDGLLLLLAYERWGPSCVERLVGDFAFAIWDGRRRTLLLGRDHLGCRPLYYVETSGAVLFASDLVALLAAPDVPRRLDEPMLAARLQQTTYSIEKTQTYCAGVHRLGPASCLGVSSRAVRHTTYWSPAQAPEVRRRDERACAEELAAVLEEAVRCRLRSSFPVGVHLSGGLDSSAVAGLASRLARRSGQPLAAFSWSAPPGPGRLAAGDERRYIAALCDAEGLSCEHVPLSDAAAAAALAADFTTEPTEMAVHEAPVQRRAAERGIRTLLSGWGGDECASFSGRGHLAELVVTGRWLRLLAELASRPRGLSARLRNHTVAPLLPDWLLGLRDPLAVYGTLPATYVAPAFAARHRAAVHALRDPPLRIRPRLRDTQAALLVHGHVQRRLDGWARSGGRLAIEYRYPLLDKRVVELCLGLPALAYQRGGQRRRLFREALAGVVPELVRRRDDKGEPLVFAARREILPRALRDAFARECSAAAWHAAHEVIDLAALRHALAGELWNTHRIGAATAALEVLRALGVGNFPTPGSNHDITHASSLNLL